MGKLDMRLAQVSVAAMALALTACGGGSTSNGGGPVISPGPAPTPTPTPTPSPTPTSTPTPTPPSGVNPDLLSPLQSETFTASGVTAYLEVPSTGGSGSVLAGQSQMQIIYNADTETFTVSAGSREQSFRPQDIDQAQSNADLTTYVRTSGNTTDSFSLTTTGTGAGQTRYVAGAFWQRQVNGTSVIEGNFDAATFGIVTPVDARPVTGAASYDVRLLGARSQSANISALSGEGYVNVDFGIGAMNGSGWFRETDLNSGFVGNDINWQLFAGLGSSVNFSGIIYLNGPARLSGSLFGPNAEEIGGAFYANPNSTDATVGVLLGGRGSYPVNTATSVLTPEADSFYRATSGSLVVTRNAAGTITDVGESAGVYAVLNPDNGNPVPYTRDGRSPFESAVQGVVPRREDYRANFQYIRVLDQIETQLGRDFYDIYGFGFLTDSAGVPVTGTAIYNLFLRGAFGQDGLDDLKAILGDGTLQANFATGAITAEGDFAIYDGPPVKYSLGANPNIAMLDSGTWSGTAQLLASRHSFLGDLTFDGANDYSGVWEGGFFGPTANELISSSNLTGTSGNDLAVALFGKRNEAVSASFLPLADFPAGVEVNSLLSSTGFTYRVSQGRYYDEATDPFLYGDVFYDAAGTPPGVRLDGLYSTANTAFSAALSNDAVNVYTGQPTDLTADIDDFEVRDYVFDGQGGRVQLTYSGFAEIQGRGLVNTDGSMYYTSLYIPYGNATRLERRPTTGSASYTGATVAGRGEVWGNNGPEYYDLTGASTMTANFESGAITAGLQLQGTHLDTSAFLDFGSFSFAGTTNASGPGTTGPFTFRADSIDDAVGYFAGLFFGPNAEEFGATFDLEVSRPGLYWELRGATVGRRDD